MSATVALHRPLRRSHEFLLTPAAVLLGPMLVSAFVDTPRRIQVANSISLLGALAVAELGVVGVGLLLCHRYPTRLVLLALPYVGFLLWAAVRTAIGGVLSGAAQNGVVFALFGACVLLTGTVAANAPRHAFAVIDLGIRSLDVIALPLTYASVFLADTYAERWMVGSRVASLLALTAISWHLARWYQGHRTSGINAAMWVIAVIVSLSRTATAIAIMQTAVVLLLHLRFAPRRFVARAALVGAAAVVVALVTMPYGAEVRSRFLTAEFNVVEIAGFRVSTTGRSNLWPAIIASAQKRPIVGQGLGSSQMVSYDVGDYLAHPHNDYLRVWHDLGFVGLLLLLAAFLSWFYTLWRAVRSAATCREPSQQLALPLAGLLALGALIVAAVTDNALVYSFVMAPAGILVGAGLGQRSVPTGRHDVFGRHPSRP